MKTVDELLDLLTLEEKIALVAGYKFMRTNPILRLEIPSIKTSDGPHGLRVQPDGGDNGITNSLPSICFPTASCSANSFNPELLRKMGNAMGEEAQFFGIDVVLGPGVNIKRNPRCGRNFEYFSEDPFLAGRLGAKEVEGIQEKGISTSLKHFATNNEEDYRFMGNSVVDQRALREIYLKQFEYIVKTAKPATVMAAYNKLNGTYCVENEWLLKDVLRDEWGFEGLIMSDWGANHNRILGIQTGLDLEMPGDTEISRKWIYDAVQNGTLKIEDLNKAVKNVLTLVSKHANKEKVEEVDWERHNELAKEIALEGAVLLKNEGTLPFNEKEEVVVIGELFEKTRYQGAGSSLINAKKLTTIKEAFDAHIVNYKFEKGYDINEVENTEELIEKAVKISKNAAKVLYFIGLTDDYECEGKDRDSIKLPENQLNLLEELRKVNDKISVILLGGSVVELPFFDNVDSILNMFLSGQNVGEAAYELIFGKVSPSGRLAETWPLKYEDVPFGSEFSKTAQEVYKESIYVGYRYYLTANKEVRFPFGYGLSYSSFKYDNLVVKNEEKTVEIEVEVTNVGTQTAKEVVQVYVASPRDNIDRPIRELKGFTKVELAPNETKKVTISISKEDLKYWDKNEGKFVLEDGEYEVQIGKNSRDIELTKKIEIKGVKIAKTPQNIYKKLDFENLSDENYEEYWGIKIPKLPPKKPITLESRLSDLKSTFFGKILYGALQSVSRKEEKAAKKLPEGKEKQNKLKNAQMLRIILDSNSIISLSMSSSGGFNYNFAEMFVELANGHIIRGIKAAMKPIKAPTLPINKEEK